MRKAKFAAKKTVQKLNTNTKQKFTGLVDSFRGLKSKKKPRGINYLTVRLRNHGRKYST